MEHEVVAAVAVAGIEDSFGIGVFVVDVEVVFHWSARCAARSTVGNVCLASVCHRNEHPRKVVPAMQDFAAFYPSTCFHSVVAAFAVVFYIVAHVVVIV